MWITLFAGIGVLLAIIVIAAIISDVNAKRRWEKAVREAAERTWVEPTPPEIELDDRGFIKKESATVSVNKPSARVRDFTPAERRAHEAYQRQKARTTSPAPSKVATSTNDRRRDDDDWYMNPINPLSPLHQASVMSTDDDHKRHSHSSHNHSHHSNDSHHSSSWGSSHSSHDSGSSSSYDSGSSSSSDSGSSSSDSGGSWD